MSGVAPLQPPANPELLTTARVARGLTQTALAKMIGVPQNGVSRWETASARLEGEQLNRVAAALSYPAEVLTRRLHPCGPIHTRKRASAPTKPLAQHYNYLNMLCLHVQPLLKGVEIEAPLCIPTLSLKDFDERPEAAAEALRRSWRLPDGPVPDMVGLLERAGALVFELSFPSGAQIDALSMWPDYMQPMFFVNSAAPVDRKRWSLAHELAHVALHHNPSGNQESEADAFASEFLMPSQTAGPQLRHLTLERAIDLKRRWRTSISSLIMTAFRTGGISEDRKHRLFMQLSYRGWRLREPVELAPERPQTVPLLLKAFLDDLGYSIDELAAVMGMLPTELRATFLSDAPTLRVVR